MLLVLFSTQMYTPIEEPSLFLDMLLAEGEHFQARLLVSALLRNVVARAPRAPRSGDASKGCASLLLFLSFVCVCVLFVCFLLLW